MAIESLKASWAGGVACTGWIYSWAIASSPWADDLGERATLVGDVMDGKVGVLTTLENFAVQLHRKLDSAIASPCEKILLYS